MAGLKARQGLKPESSRLRKQSARGSWQIAQRPPMTGARLGLGAAVRAILIKGAAARGVGLGQDDASGQPGAN